MNLKKRSLCLLTVLSGSFAVSFGSQGPLGDERSSARESDSFEAGLDAIQVGNIRADLHFIASDELGGRDTPSSGLRKAARFIRARLARLNATPAGTDGSYFHTYNMVRSKLDREASKGMLRWEDSERELVFGHDYYFTSGIQESDVTGDVVFVGLGRASDVEGLDLTGRWAFAYDEGLPRGVRQRNLQAKGAIGVILATPPGREDEHGPNKARGYASWLGGRASLRVVSSDEIYPTVLLGAEAAEVLAQAVVGVLEPGRSLKVEFQEVRAVEQTSEMMELENVCGLFEGSHPELSREVIIISAHYDHVGEHDGEIFNGADDNGSGTVGMMALAEALAKGGPLDRSVLLLWVSGEEKGLKGSEAWTIDPTLPEGMRAVCNLNIDMIGRNAPDYLLITPTSEHDAYNGLTRMAEKYAPMEGFPKLGSCDEYWMRSDHMNFSVNMGIPVAFLFSDVHADYHQATDTVEKIDYDKIHRVCRLVFRMINALSSMDLAEL